MTEDVCREGDGIVAASRVAEESMRSALAVEKRTSASLQLRLSLAEDEVAESTLRADQYKAEAASLRSALDLLRARHNAMANELQEERRARCVCQQCNILTCSLRCMQDVDRGRRRCERAEPR